MSLHTVRSSYFDLSYSVLLGKCGRILRSYSPISLPLLSSSIYVAAIRAAPWSITQEELSLLEMDVTVLNGGHIYMNYILAFLSAILVSATALGQPSDAYQVRYANLNIGDSYVNVNNTGVNGRNDPADNICANVYVFDASQALVSCCACTLSPMHLKTLSAKNDLVSNTLTPGVPTGVTVALVASKIVPGDNGITCNAANNYNLATDLVGGMRAWMTTPHVLLGVAAPYVTETPFSQSVLNQGIFTKMSTYCGFIQANGSGFGICKACRQGAQAPTKM
jgi:hypothetical protein